MRSGEQHHSSRLTEARVIELRILASRGWGARRLGRRFGITAQSAWACATGRSWKHVAARDTLPP